MLRFSYFPLHYSILFGNVHLICKMTVHITKYWTYIKACLFWEETFESHKIANHILTCKQLLQWKCRCILRSGSIFWSLGSFWSYSWSLPSMLNHSSGNSEWAQHLHAAIVGGSLSTFSGFSVIKWTVQIQSGHHSKVTLWSLFIASTASRKW